MVSCGVRRTVAGEGGDSRHVAYQQGHAAPLRRHRDSPANTAPAGAGPGPSPRPARPDPAPPRTPTGPAAPRTPAPGTAATPTRAEHRQPPRPDLPLAPAPPSAADGPSGQAANLSRAGRSHSVVPTLTPATTTPQAPTVMPAPPDAQHPIRAHSAWRVTVVLQWL